MLRCLSLNHGRLNTGNNILKSEKHFSRDGAYKFVLESNLLLHEEVSVAGSSYVAKWLENRTDSCPIRILDLACGAVPLSICKILADFPACSFKYVGVDINPDQVESLRRDFRFPANITGATIIEGNAWDLASLALEDRFDIVFSGMNLHHGTPEEIGCLFLQIKEKLRPGGIFLNHDSCRPARHPYLRRPFADKNDSSQLSAMVPAGTLARFSLEKFSFRESDGEPDWRLEFIELYVGALRKIGADEKLIEITTEHVLNRDYPLSLPEIIVVAKTAGFRLDVLPLAAQDQPLKDYHYLVAATPSPKAGL